MKSSILNTVFPIPKRYFLVKGSSENKYELNAFDAALLDAGIGDVNLVKLSSILPPNCHKIEPIFLSYGSLVPIAYSSITSNKLDCLITAAVAVGIPKNENFPGLIMEYHGRESAKYSKDKVESLVEEGMRIRGRELKSIESISIDIQVEDHFSCAFAGVVLC